MSSHNVTLAIESADPFDEAAARSTHRDLWEAMLYFVSRYTPEHAQIWRDYLVRLTITGYRDGHFEVAADSFEFDFPDADERARSAAAGAHWISLSAACKWKTLERILETAGLEFAADPPDRTELVSQPERQFVELRGQLWLIAGDELVGDDETIMTDELEAEELRRVVELREKHICGCGMCRRLRPDLDFEQQWRGALERGAAEAADALEYLLEVARPSPETIAAMARAHAHTSLYRLSRSMFQLGPRLEPDLFPALADSFHAEDDPRAGAVLVAAIAGMKTSDDARQRLLLEAFEAEDPIAETAIEFVGYTSLDPDTRSEVTERLTGLVGRSESVDYAVALTLYNLYLDRDAPPVVRRAFRDLAGRAGEAAEIAERALSLLEG